LDNTGFPTKNNRCGPKAVSQHRTKTERSELLKYFDFEGLGCAYICFGSDFTNTNYSRKQIQFVFAPINKPIRDVLF